MTTHEKRMWEKTAEKLEQIDKNLDLLLPKSKLFRELEEYFCHPEEDDYEA